MNQITKDAIKYAFMDLLEEKKLENITVKDIVNKCKVNRNTFYYHFHDIYDLMDYVFTSEAEKLIEINQLSVRWKESLLSLGEYLLTHKKMIYHVYYSINRDILEKYLYDVVSDCIMRIIKEEVKGQDISEKTCQILCDFYKYALVGMLLDWIRRGMQESINDELYKIDLVFDGSMKHMLSKCEGK